MNKLGSEFIEDFEKNEKNLFGINYRVLLLMFSIISSIAVIMVVDWFKFSEIIYQIYIFIVASPCLFFGVGADKLLNLKGRIHYFFLIKRRVYKTELKK